MTTTDIDTENAKQPVATDANESLKSAKPAVHSDNDKSAKPDRADEDRTHAPNDPPGEKGEEPPVG